MEEKSETNLPAMLSPSIQNATRVISGFSILAICLIGWWTNHASETSESGGRIAPSQSLKIELNDAGERELMLMPGIGATTARRIIDDRNQNGPFDSLSELARVPGIGPKTIKEISPYCSPISLVEQNEPEKMVAGR